MTLFAITTYLHLILTTAQSLETKTDKNKSSVERILKKIVPQTPTPPSVKEYKRVVILLKEFEAQVYPLVYPIDSKIDWKRALLREI